MLVLVSFRFVYFSNEKKEDHFAFVNFDLILVSTLKCEKCDDAISQQNELHMSEKNESEKKICQTEKEATECSVVRMK